MNILYFAYGANMHEAKMRERGIDFKFYSVGVLLGHRLVFNKEKKDGTAAANIEKGEEKDEVWGVIYEFSSEGELGKLDCFEGGYERTQKDVHSILKESVGSVEVFLYQAKPERIKVGLKPSKAYMMMLIAGADEHRIPRVSSSKTFIHPNYRRSLSELLKRKYGQGRD